MHTEQREHLETLRRTHQRRGRTALLYEESKLESVSIRVDP
jgi:hypothetical protein